MILNSNYNIPFKYIKNYYFNTPFYYEINKNYQLNIFFFAETSIYIVVYTFEKRGGYCVLIVGWYIGCSTTASSSPLPNCTDGWTCSVSLIYHLFHLSEIWRVEMNLKKGGLVISQLICLWSVWSRSHKIHESRGFDILGLPVSLVKT